MNAFSYILQLYLLATYVLGQQESCFQSCKQKTVTVEVVNSCAKTSYTTSVLTEYSTKTVPYVVAPTYASTNIVEELDFQKKALKAHNVLRVKHGAQKLRWSAELQKQAQVFLETEFVCNGTLQHTNAFKAGEIGESVALGYASIEQAVQAFSHGQKYYSFANSTCVDKRAHQFTQLVWNNTEYVGCAYINCGNYYNNFFICQYTQKGNIPNEYPENVFQVLN